MHAKHMQVYVCMCWCICIPIDNFFFLKKKKKKISSFSGFLQTIGTMFGASVKLESDDIPLLRAF
jgi:hypothetical protein